MAQARQLGPCFAQKAQLGWRRIEDCRLCRLHALRLLARPLTSEGMQVGAKMRPFDHGIERKGMGRDAQDGVAILAAKAQVVAVDLETGNPGGMAAPDGLRRSGRSARAAVEIPRAFFGKETDPAWSDRKRAPAADGCAQDNKILRPGPVRILALSNLLPMHIQTGLRWPAKQRSAHGSGPGRSTTVAYFRHGTSSSRSWSGI
ncbi:hypothetical protein OA50_05317 [Mameliella alba]|uniref:Uncharacterized protein n=1 Tax=Mameliella alba TaxID=561184 RepID=A0A0B3S0J3_9RHOB|nr:hypothetical protein OA50_05317 [Mameliella alba]